MLFPKALSDDLSCGKVLNRRQIPNPAAIINAAQVATPDLMGLRDGWMIFQKIVVAGMGCGAGTVAFDLSPGRRLGGRRLNFAMTRCARL